MAGIENVNEPVHITGRLGHAATFNLVGREENVIIDAFSVYYSINYP